MPIFEYKCNSCGHSFEALIIGGKREEEITCPQCKGGDLKKMISAPFLPSSVGKPANDEIASKSCCGSKPDDKGCTPGSCCGGAAGDN
ncbi:MAG: FmdB family transcriptional regulator [Peptococcaceae bacterium BICA1-7]|nr:MAG: FmdB family transcriptional regulator [Peptococcaceae bacterium BICA1-7]HBV97005.1 zinc ribbon domain-containing protein [Desulfotomaculum sp.]